MSAILKWAYKTATGEFVTGGPCEPTVDQATEAVVRLSRNPDMCTEKYDPIAQQIVPKSQAEIDAYDASQLDARARDRFDSEKLVKAFVIWTAQKLNVPLVTARQEILAILKGL